MDKIVDFKSHLKERDQRFIHLKVKESIEDSNSLIIVVKLKQHFRDWLVIEHEKTKWEKEFTNHLNESII